METHDKTPLSLLSWTRAFVAAACVLAPAGCTAKVDCEKLMDKCLTEALGQELSMPGSEASSGAQLDATAALFDLWTTCKSVEGRLEHAATINTCLAESDCGKAARCLVENEVHYGLLDCGKHVQKQKECAGEFVDATAKKLGGKLEGEKKKEIIEKSYSDDALLMKCSQVRSKKEVAELWMRCYGEAACKEYAGCYFKEIERLMKEQGL